MRYCLALDLKNDPVLIAEYDDWHRKVWPGVLKSLYDSGIGQMEIYRVENRLFLIIEGGPEFSLEKKAAMDAANPEVQAWEDLMWKYQEAVPGGKPGQKWRLMERVFFID
jgi:L-rhamnose mutarotase